jgi:hypothetical protein
MKFAMSEACSARAIRRAIASIEVAQGLRRGDDLRLRAAVGALLGKFRRRHIYWKLQTMDNTTLLLHQSLLGLMSVPCHLSASLITYAVRHFFGGLCDITSLVLIHRFQVSD